MLEDPPEPGTDLGTVASCCTELTNHGYAHDVMTMLPSEVLRSVGPVSISGAGPFLPKGRGYQPSSVSPRGALDLRPVPPPGLRGAEPLELVLAAFAPALKQPKMNAR